MAWIALSAADVQTRLSGGEYDAVRTAALATGQGDPLVGLVGAVTDEVRGRVAACERNTLGPAGTIPAQLKAAALAVLVWRLLTRLPVGRQLLTDARRAEYDEAQKLLKDVAACQFAIESPSETGPEAMALGGVRLVGAAERQTGRQRLGGLI